MVMEEAAVVEALLCGDGQRQMLAAKRVCKATTKQRHKLAERVVASLVMMLHPPQQQMQDYDTIEATLFALLSLASGSERNKIHIVKSGAVPALLKVLHCQIESLFNLVIAALLILSSCTANKLAIAASGASQLLIEFLNSEYTNDNNHQDDDDNNIIISIQAKLDIIATLHNLSTYHQTIPSIVLSGVVVSLVQLIYGYEKSSELVEKAMALLERIVSTSETALQGAARQARAKADDIAKLMNVNENLKAVIEDLRRKSNEAEMESLREEYHQRVSTLERKVGPSLKLSVWAEVCRPVGLNGYLLVDEWPGV